MKLSLIWRENVRKIMPLIGPRIEQELKDHGYGEATASDYYQMLSEGQAQLWLLASESGKIDLLAITRIAVYPSIKRLSIELICGKNLEEAIPHLKEAEDWAAGHGCTETEARARPGITKKLQSHGFHRAYDVILHPIEGSRC